MKKYFSILIVAILFLNCFSALNGCFCLRRRNKLNNIKDRFSLKERMINVEDNLKKKQPNKDEKIITEEILPFFLTRNQIKKYTFFISQKDMQKYIENKPKKFSYKLKAQRLNNEVQRKLEKGTGAIFLEKNNEIKELNKENFRNVLFESIKYTNPKILNLIHEVVSVTEGLSFIIIAGGTVVVVGGFSIGAFLPIFIAMPLLPFIFTIAPFVDKTDFDQLLNEIERIIKIYYEKLEIATTGAVLPIITKTAPVVITTSILLLALGSVSHCIRKVIQKKRRGLNKKLKNAFLLEK